MHFRAHSPHFLPDFPSLYNGYRSGSDGAEHMRWCWCDSSRCVSMKPCPFTDQAHLPFSSSPVSLELTLKIQNISRNKQLWLKKKLPARKVLSPSQQTQHFLALSSCSVAICLRMLQANALQNSVLNLSLHCPEQERQASLKCNTRF